MILGTAKQRLFLTILLLYMLAGSIVQDVRSQDNPAGITPPSRLTNQSQWYEVGDSEVELFASYNGYDLQKQQRISHLEIGDKTLKMIASAKEYIVASAFLFDVLYSDEVYPRDIVAELTEAVKNQKKKYPDLRVVLVLDPINRAYGRRVSPKVDELVDAGVDVFYSDLVSTKSATRPGVLQIFREHLKFIDYLTLGNFGRGLSLLLGNRLPIPNQLDGNGISIEALWNASALKANHRKLLVVDSGDTFEALVSSANPHNASLPSANYAISVKGDIAKYIYMVIREDVAYSLQLRDYRLSNRKKAYRKNYLKTQLPAMDWKVSSKPQYPSQKQKLQQPQSKPKVQACFLTESRIKQRIIELLNTSKPNDQIRIQMFYLSDLDVVEAIIRAAGKVDVPIRIILDPSKDAFGKEKDGTPNRQAAAYLMQKKQELNLNLQIRWYETHGEQNHAKIMSITNLSETDHRYELFTGSANWTGKNLNDINLESNIHVRSSRRLNEKFNALFDLFWANSDGLQYTIPYHGKYEKHAGMNKWLDGEKWGFVAW